MDLLQKIYWTNVVNASIHLQCASLSNQKWKIQPTLINLHLNEYIQGLRYYPFTIKGTLMQIWKPPYMLVIIQK